MEDAIESLKILERQVELESGLLVNSPYQKIVNGVLTRLDLNLVKLKFRVVKAFTFSGGQKIKISKDIDPDLERDIQIKSLPDGILERFKYLEEIDLSHNLIKELPTNLFRNNLKLKAVHLNDNEIENLSEDLFEFNEDIQYLNFARNKIKHISSNLFDFNRLNYLNLAENQLEIIEIDFDKIPNIVSLFLNGNRISEISQNNLESLVNLNTFNITRNQINQLSHSVFSKMIDLNSIYIGYNKLEYIPDSIITKYNGFKKEVFFGIEIKENQFGSEEVKNWLKRNNLLKIYRGDRGGTYNIPIEKLLS